MFFKDSFKKVFEKIKSDSQFFLNDSKESLSFDFNLLEEYDSIHIVLLKKTSSSQEIILKIEHLDNVFPYINVTLFLKDLPKEVYVFLMNFIDFFTNEVKNDIAFAVDIKDDEGEIIDLENSLLKLSHSKVYNLTVFEKYIDVNYNYLFLKKDNAFFLEGCYFLDKLYIFLNNLVSFPETFLNFKSSYINFQNTQSCGLLNAEIVFFKQGVPYTLIFDFETGIHVSTVFSNQKMNLTINDLEKNNVIEAIEEFFYLDVLTNMNLTYESNSYLISEIITNSLKIREFKWSELANGKMKMIFEELNERKQFEGNGSHYNALMSEFLYSKNSIEFRPEILRKNYTVEIDEVIFDLLFFFIKIKEEEYVFEFSKNRKHSFQNHGTLVNVSALKQTETFDSIIFDSLSNFLK